MPKVATSFGENVKGLPLRPSLHRRPLVTGPAQGGQWPGLLCDLQSVPPSLAPFPCGRGRLHSGPCLSWLKVPAQPHLTRGPRRVGRGSFGVRRWFPGLPRAPEQVSDGLPPAWEFLLAPALPTSPAHTPCSANKGPAYLGWQDTHKGNPLRNRVDFLKGGGGLSWKGLLTQGHPTLAKSPQLRARPWECCEPGPVFFTGSCPSSQPGREGRD